jgi:predicted transcriptional regulator
MPIKDIAGALEANEASIKTIIYRLAKKEITVKIGESWGLKAL